MFASTRMVHVDYVHTVLALSSFGLVHQAVWMDVY